MRSQVSITKLRLHKQFAKPILSDPFWKSQKTTCRTQGFLQKSKRQSFDMFRVRMQINNLTKTCTFQHL